MFRGDFQWEGRNTDHPSITIKMLADRLLERGAALIELSEELTPLFALHRACRNGISPSQHAAAQKRGINSRTNASSAGAGH